MLVQYVQPSRAGPAKLDGRIEYFASNLGSLSMRRFLLVSVLAVAPFIVPVVTASSASAEPNVDTWICRQYSEFQRMHRSEYYGCALGTIHVLSGYTGEEIYKIDGTCANQLWMKNKSTKWPTVVQKCRT